MSSTLQGGDPAAKSKFANTKLNLINMSKEVVAPDSPFKTQKIQQIKTSNLLMKNKTKADGDCQTFTPIGS